MAEKKIDSFSNKVATASEECQKEINLPRKEISPPSEQCPESFPGLPKGKMEWPELVGMNAKEAAKIIKEEREGVYIQVIPPGQTFVTSDYGFNRVRLFVDASGNVERVPRIG